MVFVLRSWKKEKETNIFIIQYARFAKRSLLILTNLVSILIRLIGRKILAHNKKYICVNIYLNQFRSKYSPLLVWLLFCTFVLDVSNSETEKSGKCDCQERKIKSVCLVLTLANEQEKSLLYGNMIFVSF